jgi:adenylate kinase
MLNIVLFGAPGTGKGTQAGLLVEKYKLMHFSTGEMLRKAMREGSPVGVDARKYIDNGLLVPDDVIINVVKEEFTKCIGCNGFVFDGFPRTLPQADALDYLLKEFNSPISLVFFLEVAEDELVKRVLHRAENSGRSDDTEKIISKRIEVYREQTFPILDYFRSQNKLIEVDGMRNIETVFAVICENITYYRESHS